MRHKKKHEEETFLSLAHSPPVPEALFPSKVVYFAKSAPRNPAEAGSGRFKALVAACRSLRVMTRNWLTPKKFFISLYNPDRAAFSQIFTPRSAYIFFLHEKMSLILKG